MTRSHDGGPYPLAHHYKLPPGIRIGTTYIPPMPTWVDECDECGYSYADEEEGCDECKDLKI